MFKCKDYQICIHLGDICNQRPDCPHGDDEELCSLWNIHYLLCQSTCDRLFFAVKSFNTSIPESFLVKVLPHYAVFRHKASIHIKLFNVLIGNVSLLHITQLNLVKLCHLITGMEKLMHLNTSDNAIISLNNKCFKESLKIKVIVLSNNFILKVNKDVFSTLSKLVYLNLSNNLRSSICLEGLEFNLLSLQSNQL